MAAGDIIKTVGMRVIEVTSKTNTGITKGQLCAYDTDGFAPAVDASVQPFVVALETVVAAAGVQKTLRAMDRGVVVIASTAAAIGDGVAVMPATTGLIKAHVIPDVGATPDQSTINAAILTLNQIVGKSENAVTSAGGDVEIRLGY